MSNHWLGAQDQQRAKGSGNFVFTPDEKVCIAGSPGRGWIIISSQHNLKLEAQTV